MHIGQFTDLYVNNCAICSNSDINILGTWMNIYISMMKQEGRYQAELEEVQRQI